MAEVKLGNRHECSDCGTKFYDLGKPKPTCPKCGAIHEDRDPEYAVSRRRRKPTPKDENLDDDIEIGGGMEDEDMSGGADDEDIAVDEEDLGGADGDFGDDDEDIDDEDIDDD